MRFSSFFAVLLISQLIQIGSLKAEVDFTVDDIVWVFVGDPGNPAYQGKVGSVEEAFLIGKYEVTATQYASFLNGVRANISDPHRLYDTEMSSNSYIACLERDPETEMFRPIKGRELFPITFISVSNGMRFCNWLDHGAPQMEKEASQKEIDQITETGTYEYADEDSFNVNPEGVYFLPNQDQWVKAAFYNADIRDYWIYTTRSNLKPNNSTDFAAAANFFAEYNFFHPYLTTGEPPYLTPVGYFINSPGPYGTFDMGGNVNEWICDQQTSCKDNFFCRGGSFMQPYDSLSIDSYGSSCGEKKYINLGLRIASKTRPHQPISSSFIPPDFSYRDFNSLATSANDFLYNIYVLYNVTWALAATLFSSLSPLLQFIYSWGMPLILLRLFIFTIPTFISRFFANPLDSFESVRKIKLLVSVLGIIGLVALFCFPASLAALGFSPEIIAASTYVVETIRPWLPQFMTPLPIAIPVAVPI